MGEPRLIKRYANRKLYDTTRSSYITLDEIADMIREGDEIRIIDNKTKEDLTAVTMAQILVEEEKRQKRTGPLPTLRDLIQHSGDLLSRTTRSITEPVTHIRSSVEESVQRLIRSGEERAEETRETLRGWVEGQTKAVEDIQHRFDERLRMLTGGLNIVGRLQKELQALRARVETLEAALEAAHQSARSAPAEAGSAGGPPAASSPPGDGTTPA